MQFTERLPIQKIEYLNQMSIDEFSSYVPDMTKRELAKLYQTLKTVCRQHIKAKGEVTRLYSIADRTPLECGGRIFCGNSIQGMTKIFRGFLCQGIATDIDMANCHPTILSYICKQNSISFMQLNTYIEHREEILKEFPNREEAKKAFLKSLNDDKLSRLKNKTPFFEAFDKEIKHLQKKIIALPQFKEIVEMPSMKKYNLTGSKINRIMCYYEDQILKSAITHLQTKCGFEVMAPFFDGCLIYGDHYSNTQILADLTDVIEKLFPGLNMKWTFKDHDLSIQMPPEFKASTKKKDELKSYEIVKSQFEETHTKIINRSIFLKQEFSANNNVHTFSIDKLKTSYGHLKYETYDEETEKVEKCGFITRWLQDEYMSTKKDTGVYPNEDLCPDNMFNLWVPFAMENVSEWTHKEEELQMVRKHILILCGNDQLVADYFEAWLGQMIAYPETKSTFPVIISAQGSGKGSFLQLIEKMLGTSKILETTTPSRDVWGDFNSPMATSFFVCLNELSKKETTECDHRIKGLITDKSLTINTKGIQQYTINSYHRFIGFTNNSEGGINTTRGDRRKWIVRASDELVNNHSYFKKFYEMIENENVIKTCYEYFKNLPNLENFTHIPLPTTDYQQDLKENNSSPIERWIVQYSESWGENPSDLIKVKAYSAFDDYKSWAKHYSPGYEISATLFGTRLKQLNIDGISKGRSKTGNVYMFKVPEVRAWLTSNVYVEEIDEAYNIEEPDCDGVCLLG